MKIAIVSLPGRDLGGILALIGRMAVGFNKIGDECDIVCIGRGTTVAKHLTNFIASDRIITTVDAGIVNNNYDVVIYECPGAFTDIGYKGTGLPYYYSILEDITLPQFACIADAGTIDKWCPFITFFEERCKAFLSIKHSLASYYQSTSGYVDTYVFRLPINTDVAVNLDKKKIVASSHRIYSAKQYKTLSAALNGLDWEGVVHSSTKDYFLNKFLLDEGILHIDNSPTIDYDALYRYAALVYSASILPVGSEGGMENVAIEGSVRGAVPLMTDYWIGHIDSPSDDMCYRFTPTKDGLELRKLLQSIEPASNEYKAKQRRILDYVNETRDDRKVAKLLHRILEGSI